METLFLNHGDFVSREDIMVKLWENEAFIDVNTLAVNMTRLRKKLTGLGLKNFIVKKRLGYGLNKGEAGEQ